MSEETRCRVASETLRDSPAVEKEASSQETARLYEFGPFRLDPAERKLWRGNEIVALTPKAFDTLYLLVRNTGRVLEKDDLISFLWPDTFVEEGSLTNHIFLLRKALGDNPSFIETVPRRGYRFVGAVRQLPHVAPPLEKTLEGCLQVANEVPVASRPSSVSIVFAIVAGLTLLVIGALVWSRHASPLPDRSEWVSVTKFPDSVSQPALSSDGHMLAFIRGEYTFFGPGQVYVKILPDGQPVQITHDALDKMSPVFSPDGARVAYTTVDPRLGWDTWVVPTLGGEPQPWLRNASGLVWTPTHQVMFSKTTKFPHMGIVSAEENRIGERDVYMPAEEPGMAHRSYPSPDGKSALVVEMDRDHVWSPCRLVPMDGRSRGHQVGPPEAACTFAAWSPDGKWMYFTSDAGGGLNHIWRERFPGGEPQQITAGPTEEEGIAIAPDGRSFVTAVALENVSVWIHDSRGERQISQEGNATEPKFTPDGKKLCYRIVKKAANFFQFVKMPGEVWVANLESGRATPLASGFQVLAYDISPDGRQVVLEAEDREGKPRLWLTSFEREIPPKPLPNLEGRQPKFGGNGEIFFRGSDGFVYRVWLDGKGVQKALQQPVLMFLAAAPDGKWLVAWARTSDNGPAAVYAFPLGDGPPVLIRARIRWQWSPGGRFLSLVLPFHEGHTYIVPLPPGETLPNIPPGGLQSEEDFARLTGARTIDALRAVPSPVPGIYAFSRNTTQRNLYRIPIP